MKEINYVTYFAQSLGGKHTANGKLHVYETFIKDGKGRPAPLHSYYNVNDKGAVIDAYFDISDVASLLENGSPDSVIADIKRPGGFDFVGTRNYNGHTCIYADLSDHRISPNYDHVSQAASWLMIVHKIFARRYGGSSREQNMVDADLKSWSAESAEKKGKNLTRMGLISLVVCIASAIVASVASLPWLTAVSVITWWTFLIPLILGFMKKGDAKGIRANKFSFPAPGGRASSPAPAPKPASSPRPAPSPKPAAPSQSV
ncbi:MAG: hypothetical protein K6F32_01950, partial [Bacilli bacterium]|nr:hypothetical protein [Bacilli bacterium]